MRKNYENIFDYLLVWLVIFMACVSVLWVIVFVYSVATHEELELPYNPSRVIEDSIIVEKKRGNTLVLDTGDELLYCEIRVSPDDFLNCMVGDTPSVREYVECGLVWQDESNREAWVAMDNDRFDEAIKLEQWIWYAIGFVCAFMATKCTRLVLNRFSADDE